MTIETVPQPQEFTFPFVGRKEELKFLLNECDKMLHAQYRSVWIEAPAGMGKTTLVEEFLRRSNNESLKPWIVHAKLHERSSNSLVSFVEALGATLQVLTGKQQEKLFSGLSSFYQERAKKIVGGGNVLSMNMEEAVITAGYILKKLSYHFPLVVIIEDIHVLKGEASFEALRHLLAIVEHVPMLFLFLTRPSDEKEISEFQHRILREGAQQLVLDGLKEHDVKQLLGEGFQGSPVPTLMKLSGGNALLLREILRASIQNPKAFIEGESGTAFAQDATTDRIIYYLTEELQRLSKKDRQVSAIAGLLGQEFSEELLENIAKSKYFDCWKTGVLQRLEHHGIIYRERRMLKAEGENENQVSFRVSVFNHALWWEAARGLYEQVKSAKGNEKRFAEIIVPLLVKQNYPLLTDAELLVQLFHWLPRKESLPLLQYIDELCTLEAGWHFHSHEESIKILKEVYTCIVDCISGKVFEINKKNMWMFVRLLRAIEYALPVTEQNNRAMAEISMGLYLMYIDDEETFLDAIQLILARGISSYIFHLDPREIEKARLLLRKIRKVLPRTISGRKKILMEVASRSLRACDNFFSKPEIAAKTMCGIIKTIPLKTQDELDFISGHFFYLRSLHLSQASLAEVTSVVEGFLATVLKSNVNDMTIRYAYRRGIYLLIASGQLKKAWEWCEELMQRPQNIFSSLEKRRMTHAMLLVSSYKMDDGKATKFLNEYLINNVWFEDEVRRFKDIAFPLFLLEDFNTFEKLWEEHKRNLYNGNWTPHETPPLFEARIFISLLKKDSQAVDEVVHYLQGLCNDSSELKFLISIVLKKIETFVLIDKYPLHKVKSYFNAFLKNDKTLSMFDRAFYAQLFARIGVRYGHDPKEFREYVNYSLSEFEKLKIPMRVMFTAKKFAEVNLLSEKELRQILRKHENKGSQQDKPSTPDNAKQFTSPELQLENSEDGITLCCLGRMRAIDPHGNELIARRWGKRKSLPSHQKIIMLELVRAKLSHQSLMRKELMKALYPPMRNDNVSKKTFKKFDAALSVRLSQIKKGFAPYEVFVKTPEGYSLHPSVRVDLFEVKENLRKANALAHIHPVSAQWLLEKTKHLIEQGAFAKNVHRSDITALRKDVDGIYREVESSLRVLSEKITL